MPGPSPGPRAPSSGVVTDPSLKTPDLSGGQHNGWRISRTRSEAERVGLMRVLCRLLSESITLFGFSVLIMLNS